MEIIGKNSSVNLDAYIKNAKNKRKIGGSSEKASKEVIVGDKVEFSPRIKEIQEAKKLLDSIPDIRSEKVAEIKRQIENGDYQIQEKNIAIKMVKEALLNELE